jgi:hypothetical protein
MTRSTVSVLICLLGLLIAVGFAGCGGTETGNPPAPGGGGGDRNPASELGGTICDKLAGCFGGEEGEDLLFTKEECEQEIAGSETLGAAFGLEEEPPPAFAQVIDRVETSELSADEDAADECIEAIELLECDDPAVLAVEIEEEFSNVEGMAQDQSCLQVFSEP